MYPYSQHLSNLVLLVQEDWNIGWVLLQKLIDRFPAFLGVDTKHHHPLSLILAVQFLQRRNLLPAIGSPGGPEVKENHLSSIILDRSRLPHKVVQSKIGKGHNFGVGLKGTCPARTLSPGQLQRLDSPQDCPAQSHQPNRKGSP